MVKTWFKIIDWFLGPTGWIWIYEFSKHWFIYQTIGRFGSHNRFKESNGFGWQGIILRKCGNKYQNVSLQVLTHFSPSSSIKNRNDTSLATGSTPSSCRRLPQILWYHPPWYDPSSLLLPPRLCEFPVVLCASLIWRSQPLSLFETPNHVRVWHDLIYILGLAQHLIRLNKIIFFLRKIKKEKKSRKMRLLELWQ